MLCIKWHAVTRKHLLAKEIYMHALRSLNNITFGWLNQFNVVSTITVVIMDDRSQFNIHADRWTQVHSTRSSVVVTHSTIN